jgi:hypothetical protein
MKPVVIRQLLAIIIAIVVAMPVSAQWFASDPAALPTPTAFVTRLEVGDIKQAEAWLDAGLPPDFMGSRIGSGLMIGAWEGNIDLLRLFVERGADINLMNASGETPIILAAWRGNLPAVQWLLERGARINAPPRQWSALHYAVFAGHAELADYLMTRGGDINALTTNGSSVLMMAIYEGREELARKLIEKGADPRPKNDWGDAAVDWAMRFNHLNIARLLTDPEQFAVAVSQPKAHWGESRRSQRMSPELENLLTLRETLVRKQFDTKVIDRRIAAERVRIVRSEIDKRTPPVRAQTLEVSASRKAPGKQSVNIIDDAGGQASGYKVPPASYSGRPKMPPKANH